MKCTICGKEFGSGANCQNCGVDRVTGLGNYSGYNAPSNSTDNNSSASRNDYHQQIVTEPKIVRVESTVCYACGEIIPTNSKFCPVCNTNLYVTCPKCGKEYSAQYSICNACGTDRIKEQEIRWEKERRYEEARKKHEEWLKTPEGQAEHRRKVEHRKKYEEECEKKRKEADKDLRNLLVAMSVPFIILVILALVLLLS